MTHTAIVILSGSKFSKKPRFTRMMSTEAPIPAMLPHDGKRLPPLSFRDTNNTQTGNTNQVPYVIAPSMSWTSVGENELPVHPPAACAAGDIDIMSEIITPTIVI